MINLITAVVCFLLNLGLASCGVIVWCYITGNEVNLSHQLPALLAYLAVYSQCARAAREDSK